MLWLGCFFIDANAETGLHALKPGEGVESVEGFCRGLNALDEFSDMASQLLNRKYPQLGPIRVGCEQKSLTVSKLIWKQRLFKHRWIPRHEKLKVLI